MEILEQLTQHAEQVEVMRTENEATTVRFESNRLKGSQVEQTQGIAVRLVKDGRLGFAASSDIHATEALIENALESVAYGDEVPIAFPVPQPGPEVNTFDAQISELPIPRMVEIGQQVIDLITEADPEALVDVRLQRGVQRRSIRNHTGTDVQVQRTPFSLMIQVNRVQGDDVLLMFDLSGSTLWEDDVLAPARSLAEKLVLAQTLVPITSGRMPVLFSPSGGLVLALPLRAGLNGKNVYKGISPMAGKVGTQLFAETYTVVDDPTLDGRFASAAYDAEGVPHRRNAFIEDGVLQGFFYDLKTAAQAGAQSTGNGARGLFNPPGPSPTNMVVEPGERALDDLIADIDEGLLVEDVLGLGQGNVISGAFSNPLALAFKIEGGEIVGRVKNAAIAGNVYEVLRGPVTLSRESAWVYNSVRLPYTLIPEMNVVAKA